MDEKIKTKDELKQIVQKLRVNDKTIVTTNGAFDLFHFGHLKNLKFAKKQGDILIVGINSDVSIKKYKSGKRPIISQEERAKIVASTEYVDYVNIFYEKTPVKLLKIIKPNVHVKGTEYKENIIEGKIVEENGGKVVFIERDPEDISTSKIIKKILKLYG